MGQIILFDKRVATMSPRLARIGTIRISARVALLVFGCLFWLLGFAVLSGLTLPGRYLIQEMDGGLGLFLTGASLLLLLTGLGCLKTKQITRSDRFVLFSAFLVSLVPAACILWTFLSAWFTRFPGYIYESDTKHIAAGMTEAQVVEKLGSPRGSSRGDDKIRLSYDVQIAWGDSSRQFLVDLIDAKVVSARIVRYGQGDDGFFDSDFLKDLKMRKAPSQ